MSETAATAQTSPDVIDGEFTELQTTPRPMQMAVRAEMSPDDLRNQIRRQMELREIMTEYLRGSMVEGHHYYYFNKLGKQGQTEVGGPRDDKPALTQDGAYNLMGLFKCVAGPAITNIIRHGDGHITVVSEVPIYNQEGALVATGNGSCTTRESKYAYRKGERTCPNCEQPAIIKGKKEYGGGWVCFAKKGGCGAKFEDGDQSIESQTVGRVENTDIADLENTVLKMSVKRANTAGVRKLPLVSEIFATDPNEHDGVDRQDPKPQARNGARTSQKQTSTPTPTPAAAKPQDAVERAVNLAYKLQKDHSVEAEDLTRQFLPEGISKFSDLSEQQAEEIIPGLAELLTAKVQGK
jgi:hypothetical protein